MKLTLLSLLDLVFNTRRNHFVVVEGERELGCWQPSCYCITLRSPSSPKGANCHVTVLKITMIIKATTDLLPHKEY